MIFSRPLFRLGTGTFINTFKSSQSTPLKRIHTGIRFNSSNASKIGAEMETVDTTARLAKLRELMKERKVDIYSM